MSVGFVVYVEWIPIVLEIKDSRVKEIEMRNLRHLHRSDYRDELLSW